MEAKLPIPEEKKIEVKEEERKEGVPKVDAPEEKKAKKKKKKKSISQLRFNI